MIADPSVESALCFEREYRQAASQPVSEARSARLAAVIERARLAGVYRLLRLLIDGRLVHGLDR